MSATRRKRADDGPKVPGWIVSYTDMITLLLSFFVLLQVFTKERDQALFLAGQGSFRRAIEGLGIPDLLLGDRDILPEGYRRLSWWVEPTPERFPENRVIDADDRRIRAIFEDVREKIETETYDTNERLISVYPAGFGFPAGTDELTEAARSSLRTLAATLRHDLAGQEIRIRVLALAGDEREPERRWLLSGRRARLVEQTLREAMAEEIETGRWQIESLGVGAGGRWCTAYGIAPEESSVAIAVIGTKDNGQGQCPERQ